MNFSNVSARIRLLRATGPRPARFGQRTRQPRRLPLVPLTSHASHHIAPSRAHSCLKNFIFSSSPPCQSRRPVTERSNLPNARTTSPSPIGWERAGVRVSSVRPSMFDVPGSWEGAESICSKTNLIPLSYIPLPSTSATRCSLWHEDFSFPLLLSTRRLL